MEEKGNKKGIKSEGRRKRRVLNRQGATTPEELRNKDCLTANER